MKLGMLFNIILKVLGFFIIKDILVSLPYILMPLISFAGDDSRFDTGTLVVTALILALYFSIAYVLIFQTNSIVNLLKLEPQLSDEYLTFEISAASVLTIALIILGLYILVDTIPSFCNQAFNYYEQSHERYTASKPPVSGMVISVVKIIIALLILGERKRIVQLVQKDTPVQEEMIDTEG